jgi:hypothetical protein
VGGDRPDHERTTTGGAHLATLDELVAAGLATARDVGAALPAEAVGPRCRDCGTLSRERRDALERLTAAA